MRELESSFSSSIRSAVFDYDDELISTILLGLQKTNSVVGVLLVNEKGELIDKVGITPKESKKGFSEKLFSIEFDIKQKSDDQENLIAKVSLYSKNSIIIERVKYGFLLIVINSFFKTGLLWFILIYFLKRYLSIPLTSFTNQLNEAESNDLKFLSYQYKFKNEFSLFKDSYNGMIDRVVSLHQRIKTQNENLEILVEERTFELQKANKEIVKLAKIKSEFLANMSHEIRTPMNGLLGMIELLHDSGLDKKQMEMLEVVKSCGDNLLVIINDILDISKIEAGKITFEKSEFSLKKMLEELIFISSASASKKSLVLNFRLADDLPEYVNGDITRIKQIILNFLTNAIKFTGVGVVTLTAHKEESLNGSALFKFSVKDTGIGISKENLDKLFKAFTQADSTITRKFGGTGLGLSISLKLAKLMNGKVEVESIEGEGSTFSLLIPLEITNVTKKVELRENPQVANGFFSKEYPHRILLVEDNKINQKIATLMLSKIGYSCEVANNGEEAVSTLERDPNFTIIFMDMQMPVMDGLTASKEIIKNENVSHIPIIAMTANVLEEDKRACEEAGMVDFISKPINLDILRNVLIRYSKK